MLFYDNVKELAKEKHLQLIPFLESLGINYSTYKGYKQCNNLPRADEAVAIAKALGTSVEFLVTGEHSNQDSTELKELKTKVRQFLTELL